MKKVISTILAIAILLGCIPMNVLAADNQTVCSVGGYSDKASLLEVTSQNVPIRTGPGRQHSAVTTCKVGTILEKKSTKLNKYFNTWYEVTYSDPQNGQCCKGYIYSDYVKKHSHDYETLVYDGDTYQYCNCGKIMIRVKTEVRKSNALAIAGTAAGTLSVADGPAPVGDVIGVGLLITLGLLNTTGVIPDVSTVQSVYEDIDIKRFEEDDSCPVDSYRRVSRAGGTLTCIDKECLSLIAAYVWVRTGNDVWCRNWDTALKLGSLHPGGCFSEIDGSGKDYWYHFHLGQSVNGKHENVVGGHIFYGTSAITNKLPIGG